MQASAGLENPQMMRSCGHAHAELAGNIRDAGLASLSKPQHNFDACRIGGGEKKPRQPNIALLADYSQFPDILDSMHNSTATKSH